MKSLAFFKKQAKETKFIGFYSFFKRFRNKYITRVERWKKIKNTYKLSFVMKNEQVIKNFNIILDMVAKVMNVQITNRSIKYRHTTLSKTIDSESKPIDSDFEIIYYVFVNARV